MCIGYEGSSTKALAGKAVNVPRRGDYFHDGADVLSIMDPWHKFLRSSVRKSDTFTGKVLDIIDEGLLVNDVEKRLDVDTLYSQLKHALDAGGKECSLFPGIDPEIEEFWREDNVGDFCENEE